MSTSPVTAAVLLGVALVTSACGSSQGQDATLDAGTVAEPSTPPAHTGSADAVSGLRLELLRPANAPTVSPARNPFRFQPRAEPMARAGVASTERVVLPAAPAGPPPPPPIPLRFIGVLNAPQSAGHVALLSDGRGNVMTGKEGDIIEGRYRLLRIGADSVELAYVDGRGRQVIRLSGQ